MGVMAHLPFARPRPELRYVRPPEPVVFPESAIVPENKSHLVLRTFLFRLLRAALGPEHSVGSEQFVYWNARDPKRSLSPDAFVKLHVPDTSFPTWKTWENGGVPELAVEILSPSDADAATWEGKLARYCELGVRELVWFDRSAPEGERLRVWDRVKDDLVERVVAGDRAPCLTLGVDWVVRPVESEATGLRLVDGEGRLLLVPEEAARVALAEAEARTAALEAELRRRS
jgi:Uma2 family endonuclease